MIATAVRQSPVPCMQDDLSAFCCQNLECPDFGKKGVGNLRVDSYYGKAKAFRLLCCRSCRTRFSERRGSELFGSQLSPDTVVLLFKYLDEGRGIRETARLLDINRNTVVRDNCLRRNRRTEDRRPS